MEISALQNNSFRQRQLTLIEKPVPPIETGFNLTSPRKLVPVSPDWSGIVIENGLFIIVNGELSDCFHKYTHFIL